MTEDWESKNVWQIRREYYRQMLGLTQQFEIPHLLVNLKTGEIERLPDATDAGRGEVRSPEKGLVEPNSRSDTAKKSRGRPRLSEGSSPLKEAR